METQAKFCLLVSESPLKNDDVQIFLGNRPHNLQAHTTLQIYMARYLLQPIQSFLTVDSVSASRSPAERLHKTTAFNLYVFALDVP